MVPLRHHDVDLVSTGVKFFSKMLRMQFVTLYRVALKQFTVRFLVEHLLKHKDIIVILTA